MKTLSQIIGILLLGTLLISCSSEGSNSNSTKPKARGSIGEIILVIDSAKYAGPVGDALKDIFEADLPGMVRSESKFKVNTVDPRAMTRMLKMSTNLIYVTTFDDKGSSSQVINAQFSKESKEKALNDPSLYSLRVEDEYAVGQEVLYLFGNTEEQLVKNLKKNGDRLQNLFEVRERGRLEKIILARKNTAANAEAEKNLGIQINVPASYQVAKSVPNFLWVRQPTPTANRADISLFFHVEDYVSEEQTFPENILKIRDSVARNHIFGDPDDPTSYVVTEKQIVPAFRNMVINDNFTTEIRASWKTNNISMGGSYLGYLMVDEKKGKLYYIEGFVFYPNEVHRDALREIETILLNTDVSWIPDQGA
jgi:ribosomal protein S21